MKIKKQIAALLVSIVLSAAGTVLIGALIKPVQRAPNSAILLLDGRRMTLAAYQGRPLLVLFWSTSCKTCIEDIPKLKRLYREFKPHGFELIAVAMPYDPPISVKAFNDKYKLPYPIALDADGQVYRAFGDIPGTPTFYLINGQGQIVSYGYGKLDMAALRRQIMTLINRGRQSV